MVLLPIAWQNIFHRCIDQRFIMRFNDAGYILGATVAHLHCAYIKYFVKLVVKLEVVT